MSLHSLSDGQRVIDNIDRLGTALDYLAMREWPLEPRPTSAAVDVVWFSEPEQTAPILMFEVETTPAASLSNNAMKILGRDSSVLLKPLFFFHVVVKGGRHSGRIDATESTFYSHNYEIYLLSEGDALRFLNEILTQHRRLRNRLDLLNVIQLVVKDWPSVSLSGFLEHIEALGFSVSYLENYALLSDKLAPCREGFFRYLLNAEKTHVRMGCDYARTYIGSNWSRPIHLALLAHEDKTLREEYTKKLRHWQEESSFMSQIGPHWGLSRDYDEFIACLSPFLWALVAGLLGACPETQAYICDQMITVLKTMLRPMNYVTFFHAVWLLYVSSACGHHKGFDFARRWINEHGGIGETSLLRPPAIVYCDDANERWIFGGPTVQVPSMLEFCSVVANHSRQIRPDISQLALHVLVHPLNQTHADALVEHLGVAPR